MSDVRWQRLRELFEAASTLDPQARPDYLQDAEADPAMRVEVLALLQADGHAAHGVECAVRRAVGAALPCAPYGTRLGAYRVIGEIGSGGMGTVVLAERADDSYHQRVAIKLLHGLPTRDGTERMRRERQILADLDHPNIARLLDGGVSADGQPYLVMDYVEGEPVTLHCASLPIERRLELFMRVCAAVHYAHQRLVVHRDIKPENVLVRADGEPMLLDFGIARLLEGDAGTGVTRMFFTPGYASPEQRRGDPVSTASDVYMLGVLLAEILCGTHVMPRADAAVELPRGSLRSLPRGRSRELAAIVARATAPLAAHRYQSAEALSDEIARYQCHQPLRATPERRVFYRAAKFVRRHAYACAVVLLFLAVAAGSAWRLLQERDRAIRAEARARAESLASERVLDYVISMFDSAAPEAAGNRAITPRELVDIGRRRLDEQLGGQPLQQARLLAAFGAMYIKLGQIEPAIASLRSAVEIERAQGRTDRLARGLHTLGYALNLDDRPGDAEAALREAVAIWRGLPSDDAVLADLLSTLAIAQTRNGNPAGAIVGMREALEHAERSDGADGKRVGEGLYALAQAQIRGGDAVGAQASVERSLAILRARLPANAPSVLSAIGTLGGLYQELGDYAQAEALQREMLERRIETIDAGSTLAVNARNNLAYVILLQGRAHEAEALFAQNLEHIRQRTAQDTPAYRITLKNLGMAGMVAGDYAAAELRFRDALTRIEREFDGVADPNVSVYRQNLAEALLRRGRLPEAHALLEPEVPGTANTPVFSTASLRRWILLAEWACRERRFGEAQRDLANAAQALDGIESSGRHAAARRLAAELARTRGHVLRDSGDLEQAQAAFASSLQVMAEAQLDSHPFSSEVAIELADVQWRRGRHDEARAQVRRIEAGMRRQFAADTQAARDFEAMLRRADAG